MCTQFRGFAECLVVASSRQSSLSVSLSCRGCLDLSWVYAGMNMMFKRFAIGMEVNLLSRIFDEIHIHPELDLVFFRLLYFNFSATL